MAPHKPTREWPLVDPLLNTDKAHYITYMVQPIRCWR